MAVAKSCNSIHVQEEADTWLTTENRRKIVPRRKKEVYRNRKTKTVKQSSAFLLEFSFSKQNTVTATKQTDITTFFKDKTSKGVANQAFDENESVLPHVKPEVSCELIEREKRAVKQDLSTNTFQLKQSKKSPQSSVQDNATSVSTNTSQQNIRKSRDTRRHCVEQPLVSVENFSVQDPSVSKARGEKSPVDDCDVDKQVWEDKTRTGFVDENVDTSHNVGKTRLARKRRSSTNSHRVRGASTCGTEAVKKCNSAQNSVDENWIKDVTNTRISETVHNSCEQENPNSPFTLSLPIDEDTCDNDDAGILGHGNQRKRIRTPCLSASKENVDSVFSLSLPEEESVLNSTSSRTYETKTEDILNKMQCDRTHFIGDHIDSPFTLSLPSTDSSSVSQSVDKDAMKVAFKTVTSKNTEQYDSPFSLSLPNDSDYGGHFSDSNESTSFVSKRLKTENRIWNDSPGSPFTLSLPSSEEFV